MGFMPTGGGIERRDLFHGAAGHPQLLTILAQQMSNMVRGMHMELQAREDMREAIDGQVLQIYISVIPGFYVASREEPEECSDEEPAE